MYNVQIPVAQSTPSKQIENGSYTARIVHIIDLGTQKLEWQGQVKYQRQVRIVFETPDDKTVFSQEKGEQPYLLNKTVTFSISKPDTSVDKQSKLTLIVKAVLGKTESVNIYDLLGKLCMIQTEISQKGYAEITGFSQLPKQLSKIAEAIPTINAHKALWLGNEQDSVGEFNDEEKTTFDSLPDFIKQKIIASPEYNYRMFSKPVTASEIEQATSNEPAEITEDELDISKLETAYEPA